MYKRLIAIFLLFLPALCFGWGRQGHSTIAQIAQNHLRCKAAKAINAYLGGQSLAMIASDADAYRGVWTMDLGFVPTNIDFARPLWLNGFDRNLPENIVPWSHTITVDENGKSFRTDRHGDMYIPNMAYYVDVLAEKLKKEAETMDPDLRYRYIALIVHFLGDMHNPLHIEYYPDNFREGHVDVCYRGETVMLHRYWDDYIFDDMYPWSFGDLAYLADTFSRSQRLEATRGDVYNWAEDSASVSRFLNYDVPEGYSLPPYYAEENREFLFSQLRKAGYRLAKVLNYIFG